MRTLVLASTSIYRRRLLQQLELPFLVAAPQFEERIEPGVAPELLVKHQALGKAQSLAKRYPDALIIGSDQVFIDSRGRVLGKPGGQQGAISQLRQMARRQHTFHTGIALFDSRNGRHLVEDVPFTVTLRELTDEEIGDYVARENPIDCAGSFKIEGLGISLMQSMAGGDYNSLIGLPLIKLVAMLQEFEIPVLAPPAR